MGSKWRTTHLENKRQTIHKDSMNGIKANARRRVEQDVNLVLKNMKLKIPSQPHDEVLVVTNSRYKKYKANEDRIILKDGLLFRNYFGETGSIKHYQIFDPIN